MTLLVLIGGGALLIAAVTAIGLASGVAGSADSRDGYMGSEPPVRLGLPSFDFQSYAGGTVTDDDLRGSVVLLTLLDSQCTDACPVLAWTVARAIDGLTKDEREQVRAVGLTVDPVEDTPVSVRRFLRAQRAEGRLEYLLGAERELRPVWEEMMILPSLDSGSDSLHSAPLRIYDREGTWVSTLHAGADLSEDNLLHDIRRAIGAATQD